MPSRMRARGHRRGPIRRRWKVRRAIPGGKASQIFRGGYDRPAAILNSCNATRTSARLSQRHPVGSTWGRQTSPRQPPAQPLARDVRWEKWERVPCAVPTIWIPWIRPSPKAGAVPVWTVSLSSSDEESRPPRGRPRSRQNWSAAASPPGEKAAERQRPVSVGPGAAAEPPELECCRPTT